MPLASHPQLLARVSLSQADGDPAQLIDAHYDWATDRILERLKQGEGPHVDTAPEAAPTNAA